MKLKIFILCFLQSSFQVTCLSDVNNRSCSFHLPFHFARLFKRKIKRNVTQTKTYFMWIFLERVELNTLVYSQPQIILTFAKSLIFLAFFNENTQCNTRITQTFGGRNFWSHWRSETQACIEIFKYTLSFFLGAEAKFRSSTITFFWRKSISFVCCANVDSSLTFSSACEKEVRSSWFCRFSFSIIVSSCFSFRPSISTVRAKLDEVCCALRSSSWDTYKIRERMIFILV